MAIGVPTSLGSNVQSGDGVTTTNVVTTAANIAAGSLSVVAIAVTAGSAIAVSSVSDGTNAYSKAVSGTDGQPINTELEIWYCANCAAVAAGASLTVTFASAPPGGGFPNGVLAATVTGVNTSTPLDQTPANSSSASATNVSVTTGTLGSNNEIAFGASYSISSVTLTETEQNSFTNVLRISFGGGLQFTLDYLIVVSTAAITFNPTWNTAHQMGGALATFKGPASGFVPYQPWAQLGPIMAQFEAIGRSLSGWRRRESGLLTPQWSF